MTGEIGARPPDRERERWRLWRSLNVPIEGYDFSFSAGHAPHLERVEIGPNTCGYDYADRQGRAIDRPSEPANLRAAIAELTRIAPFVDIHVHDFVGNPTGPSVVEFSRLTPGTPEQPKAPMHLRAALAREYAAAEPTPDGRTTWMAAARTGFLAHYYSGRLSMDDIVAIHQDLAANDWRPYHDELFFGTIDFSTDYADEHGRLALAASRYAVWARENGPMGPSPVEQGPGGGRAGDAVLSPGNAPVLRDDPNAAGGDGLRHPADPPSGIGALTPAVSSEIITTACEPEKKRRNDRRVYAATNLPSECRQALRETRVAPETEYLDELDGTS